MVVTGSAAQGDQCDVVRTAENSLFVDVGRPPEFPKVVLGEQVVVRPPFDHDRVGREDATFPEAVKSVDAGASMLSNRRDASSESGGEVYGMRSQQDHGGASLT